MAQTKTFYTLDVFTNQRFAGNPLAVVGDGDGLTPQTMQTVAGEFNLSETVFLCAPKSDEALASLRIFTPVKELPFAGHPTIGAALLIARLAGKVPASGETSEFILDLEAGQSAIEIWQEGADLKAELIAPLAPTCEASNLDRGLMASALGLDAHDLQSGQDPLSCSAGNDFLVVELSSRQALSKVKMNWAVFDGLALPNFYLICQDAENDQLIHARMTARGIGIAEDPATGSAVAALPAYLAQAWVLADTDHSFMVHQGYDMGRPSQIGLKFSIAGGQASKARVSGSAVEVMQGSLTLEH